MFIREQILKNKDKNILVEFGAKIQTHAKYVHGCIFKIVLPGIALKKNVKTFQLSTIEINHMQCVYIYLMIGTLCI